MKVLMILVGPADGPAFSKDHYLKWFDADARHGWGDLTTTAVRDEALRFDDIPAAWACWQTQSTVKPIRDDGRPNKPLTAYTVTFETTET